MLMTEIGMDENGNDVYKVIKTDELESIQAMVMMIKALLKSRTEREKYKYWNGTFYQQLALAA